MELNETIRNVIPTFIGSRSYIYYTLSGSHLYGFPSSDSDIDIRGCHILTAHDVLGIKYPRECIETTIGEFDFVSFDIRKEMALIMENNSNVMEHVFATPVEAKSKFATVREIAKEALSKKIYNPYYGMSKANWKKYLETFSASFIDKPAKKYLYVLRGLLAGIYVLDTHVVEPDITKLNKYFKYPVVDELVKIKIEGGEKKYVQGCPEADGLIEKLWKDIEIAKENSTLPNKPSEEVFEKANEFVISCR